MELVRDLGSEKIGNYVAVFGIFYCPQCRKRKKRVKAAGLAAKYCSHECLSESGHRSKSIVDKRASQLEGAHEVRECLSCGKVGGHKDIEVYRKIYWCSKCLNRDVDIDLEDHIYTGTSNIGEL